MEDWTGRKVHFSKRAITHLRKYHEGYIPDDPTAVVIGPFGSGLIPMWFVRLTNCENEWSEKAVGLSGDICTPWIFKSEDLIWDEAERQWLEWFNIGDVLYASPGMRIY